MNLDPAPKRREILRRLERIERHPDVLERLLGPLARRAGQSVAAVVAEEADSIYRDALGCRFTRLELAAVRCRCNIGRLAIIPARAGSAVACTIANERQILARIEHAIAHADGELAAAIMARLRARGRDAWSKSTGPVGRSGRAA